MAENVEINIIAKGIADANKKLKSLGTNFKKLKTSYKKTTYLKDQANQLSGMMYIRMLNGGTKVILNGGSVGLMMMLLIVIRSNNIRFLLIK